jgi:hypothetical protein
LKEEDWQKIMTFKKQFQPSSLPEEVLMSGKFKTGSGVKPEEMISSHIEMMKIRVDGRLAGGQALYTQQDMTFVAGQRQAGADMGPGFMGPG